jgi:hypothetical protein
MRRRRVRMGVIVSIIGIFELIRFNGDPRLLAPGAAGVMFHGADVLGLLVSGVCLGLGFAALSGLFKLRGE